MLPEDRINLRLQQLGKKKAWLMEQMGMSPATFWRKIGGKSSLTYEEMQLLADALGCTPDYLTGRSDAPGDRAPAHPAGAFKATQDLDKLMRDLAGYDPDFGILFRGAVNNWNHIPDKTKEKIAQIFKVGLGLAEIDELGGKDVTSDDEL